MYSLGAAGDGGYVLGRLLEWMLCVDQPSGGCWIFRSGGIIFVLLILKLQCSSSLFSVVPGTMVLFLGVQMKLLPIVFTNNNSSTPFHHFLLPPTFHPHPTLSFSASSCSAPPPWWVQLFSKLWLHGGWIWFIFAHRPFHALPWKHRDELRVKSPILHSSFPVNNNNREGQLHVGLEHCVYRRCLTVSNSVAYRRRTPPAQTIWTTV